MWKDLSVEWQAAFIEAWNAFKCGSIPIGAVIADEEGNILIKEHNRAKEKETLNGHISHAEANALRSLDTSMYNPKTVTLYSTMEPCPMCMGTAVMSNIKRLRYAARDPYCGAVHLKDSDPYIMSNNLDYVHVGGETEFVQLTIQSYHELGYISRGASDKVLNCFRNLDEKAVSLAERLYADKRLDIFSENGADFSEVYDFLLSEKEKI